LAGPGESPAVARRRVLLALRRARDAAGLSQGEVATSTGWSTSKVQRIESGENAISITDLRALLLLYGVTDPAKIEPLVVDAQISRRQRWSTSSDVREHVTPAMSQLVQFEAEATAIRSYQPVVVPGLFQTPAYARFLLDWFTVSLTDDERRVRFDLRMQRRRRFLESTAGPEYYLLLDESALKRDIGGLEVMAGQLESLVETARRPDVHIRITPLQEGAFLGLVGQFSLFDLSRGDIENVVLYRESFSKDSMDHDPKEIEYFRSIFETFWRQSLDEEKSIRAIGAEAAALRVSIDRT